MASKNPSVSICSNLIISPENMLCAYLPSLFGENLEITIASEFDKILSFSV